MSEFKGTRGNYKKSNDIPNGLDELKGYISITTDEWDIACVFNDFASKSGNEAEHNANLIVDAFKVRQQINCELSELLEQRNEMLAMLEELLIDVDEMVMPTAMNDTIYRLKQLIKKVKDNE